MTRKTQAEIDTIRGDFIRDLVFTITRLQYTLDNIAERTGTTVEALMEQADADLPQPINWEELFAKPRRTPDQLADYRKRRKAYDKVTVDTDDGRTLTYEIPRGPTDRQVMNDLGTPLTADQARDSLDRLRRLGDRTKR